MHGVPSSLLKVIASGSNKRGAFVLPAPLVVLTKGLAKAGSSLFTLWVIGSLTFVLLRLLPGGPFDNPKLPASVLQALEVRYGLNQPLWYQYLQYWAGVLQGNLGPSLVQEGRFAQELLADALPVSLTLGGLALAVGLPCGSLLGLWAALRFGTVWDKALSTVGALLLAAPSFLIAGLLVWLLALQWHWLPAATLSGPEYYVLPTLTLAVLPFTFSFFLVREQALTLKHELYVAVKEAAGLSPRRLAFVHLLRGAVLPLCSLLGPLLANVLTGSFAVETLFALPGLGRQFIQAIVNRDYTVVLAATLLYALLLLGFNALSAWLLRWLDPRLAKA